MRISNGFPTKFQNSKSRFVQKRLNFVFMKKRQYFMSKNMKIA